ncbi:MAG: lamin tail domain-containing protein [Verrucomicrobiota bacterium]
MGGGGSGAGSSGAGVGGVGGDGRGGSAAASGDRGTGGTAGTAATGGGGGGALGSGGSAGSPAPAPVPVPGDLAIVELLTNPASTDTGREWIEVLNKTTHALSLAGMHIADAANDAAVDFTAGGGLLDAGKRAVFVQSADATKNGGITLGAMFAGGSFGTLVSLNNDADSISVCVGPCATGVLIDRVTWDAGLGTGYDGHAVSIDDAGRRCPATQPFGDGGSFGTPGGPNGTCP